MAHPALDDRQQTVLKTFTREQLEGMSLDDLVALVGQSGTQAKFHGVGVVKRADGSIKYAPEAIPGNYFETPEELAAHAKRELEKPEVDHVVMSPKIGTSGESET